mmetsp:Transcript_84039/g.224606  ORF Transcript_84039/g.224606 Transcript_84039/m.224606 type:complete len:294 (-) Transcript_84039:648-1529(-)
MPRPAVGPGPRRHAVAPEPQGRKHPRRPRGQPRSRCGERRCVLAGVQPGAGGVSRRRKGQAPLSAVVAVAVLAVDRDAHRHVHPLVRNWGLLRRGGPRREVGKLRGPAAVWWSSRHEVRGLGDLTQRKRLGDLTGVLKSWLAPQLPHVPQAPRRVFQSLILSSLSAPLRRLLFMRLLGTFCPASPLGSHFRRRQTDHFLQPGRRPVRRHLVLLPSLCLRRLLLPAHRRPPPTLGHCHQPPRGVLQPALPDVLRPLRGGGVRLLRLLGPLVGGVDLPPVHVQRHQHGRGLQTVK